MSVRFHEAFSIDSARRQFNFSDHFLGDSLRDLWAVGGGAGGSAVVVDAQDGGVLRITTDGDTNDVYFIDWNDIRSFHVDKKVTMEFRIKVEDKDNSVLYAGLLYDVNNRIVFYNNGGAIRTTNGGTATSEVSGHTQDNDYHIYRIECFPAGEVHFYIDGVETANSPITTDIPSDAGDYLQPYFYIRTSEDVEHYVDLDYVVVRQEI